MTIPIELLGPFARVSEIKIGRPLTADETDLATALLDRASMKLRLRIPGIDARVTADPLARQAARLAVLAAVERVLKNPDGMKQLTDTAGPFSQSRTLADSIVSGLLYFTAEDLIGLAPSLVPGVPLTARVRSGYPRPGVRW